MYKVITTPTHLDHTHYPMHDLLLPLNDYEYEICNASITIKSHTHQLDSILKLAVHTFLPSQPYAIILMQNKIENKTCFKDVSRIVVYI